MIVYLAVNKINRKYYVGITNKPLECRISNHLCSMSGAFPKALRKYGVQAFEFSIIDIADSREILLEKEMYWIKFYNSKVPNGYNMTDGGEGTTGLEFSQETRKKMSDAKRGKHWSEDHKNKLSIICKEKSYWKGRKKGPLTKEQKKKISEATRGLKRDSFSLEHREKLSKSHKGKIPWNKGKKIIKVSKSLVGIKGVL